MKLENRRQKVTPLPHFLFRLGRYGLFSLGLMVLSVLLGNNTNIIILLTFPGLTVFIWHPMILTGMGPVAEMTSSSAKIFLLQFTPCI
ncbi:MAG: hypothetical protein U5K51_17020 [Flavobacteriaceae bacterium]|nr:hypothetical protein [Flavobacteriaceae bacterium]